VAFVELKPRCRAARTLEKKLGEVSGEDTEDCEYGTEEEASDRGDETGDWVRRGQANGAEDVVPEEREFGPVTTVSPFLVSRASATTATQTKMSKLTVFIVTGGYR
jgi:hypothetical protein